MVPSDDYDRLVKGDEGCRLTAYPDPFSPRGIELRKPPGQRTPGWQGFAGDPWTIAYGETGPNIVEGLTISQDWADRMFEERAARVAVELDELLDGLEVTQGQYDAMASLVENCGQHILMGSRLLEKLWAGDILGAADEFLSDDHARGRVVEGLLERRQAERELFLNG